MKRYLFLIFTLLGATQAMDMSPDTGVGKQDKESPLSCLPPEIRKEVIKYCFGYPNTPTLRKKLFAALRVTCKGLKKDIDEFDKNILERAWLIANTPFDQRHDEQVVLKNITSLWDMFFPKEEPPASITDFITKMYVRGDSLFHYCVRWAQFSPSIPLLILASDKEVLETCNKNEELPLHAAVARGNIQAAKQLLAAGADIKKKDHWGSILRACVDGLDNPIDPLSWHLERNPSVGESIRLVKPGTYKQNQLPLLRLLFAYGADMRQDKVSPLIHAQNNRCSTNVIAFLQQQDEARSKELIKTNNN